MIYTAEITTPSNTLATSLYCTRLKVTKGLVYKIEIMTPPGCEGMHKLAIFDGGYQAWPSTPGSFFTLHPTVITFDDTYLKLAPPFEFDIKTYNLDEKWDHYTEVRIGLVSNEIFMARFLPTYTYKYFKDMLDAMQAEQKARQGRETEEVLSEGVGFGAAAWEVE